MSREEKQFREGAVKMVSRKQGVYLDVRRTTTAQRANQEKYLSKLQREEVRWVA